MVGTNTGRRYATHGMPHGEVEVAGQVAHCVRVCTTGNQPGVVGRTCSGRAAGNSLLPSTPRENQMRIQAHCQVRK